MSGAETARRRVVQRRIGGAEMALPPDCHGNTHHRLNRCIDRLMLLSIIADFDELNGN